MQKWDYMTLRVEATHRGWTAKFTDQKITGLTEILQLFGEEGWELINAVPLDATLLFPAVNAGTMALELIFKRPRPEAA